MAAAVPSVVTERVPPRHDEVIRRRTAEMIHRCVSELAQQRRRGGERLLRDQLDEDLRPVLAQQRRSAAQHAHLHAFHVDLEKRDWKGGQRGRQFSEQIVESPKLDALAGRRRRARYDVARADVAVVLVAQGHHAGRVGVADADGYDGGPLAQGVRVEVPSQDRVKAGIGLDRHDVVGAEAAEEHGVVADVAADVEVDAAARPDHGDVLELIDFPERFLRADDVRDLVGGVVALQAHQHGVVVTRPPCVAGKAGRGST